MLSVLPCMLPYYLYLSPLARAQNRQPNRIGCMRLKKRDVDEAGRVAEWEGERIAESDMWWAF